MLFPLHKSRGTAADAQPWLLRHRTVWGWEQARGLAVPSPMAPRSSAIAKFFTQAPVLFPHLILPLALAEMGPQEFSPRFPGLCFSLSHTETWLGDFHPPFSTVLSRTLSQDLREAYFSAEQRPAACAPHHPFPSAFWPRRTKSLWKAAGLRTPSPRSTWLKPLNDQLGMSHVSSPRLRNPARSLYTRLK